MRYIYDVRKDFLEIDEEKQTVYGIDVIHNSAVIKSVIDLFCDKETAGIFAKPCGNICEVNSDSEFYRNAVNDGIKIA